MVLKEIILLKYIIITKDIILVFIFAVVAFACCLHTVQMIVASHDVVLLGTTVYEVFMSALGVGDFTERVTEDSVDIESSMALFFTVYAFCACFTLIILMNILIAMLSVRAEWLQSLSSSKTDSRCIKMMISFNDTINERSKSMYTSFCES